MRQSRCAAVVLGIALAVGATLGAAATFLTVFVSLRALPSARADLDSWTGAANVAGVAAVVGAIAGLVLSFLATRPGMMLDARLFTIPIVVSALLAVFALLMSERISRHPLPQS